MDVDSGLSVELAPLAEALRAEAERDAAERVEEARGRAEGVRAEAMASAQAVLDAARAEGEAAAERQSAHRLLEVKRQARGAVLLAEREAYDALSSSVLDTLGDEGRQSEREALEDRLEQVAKAELGDDASIQRDPEGRGGVLARADGRVLDLTLPVLVRRAIERMGEEVSRLWR